MSFLSEVLASAQEVDIQQLVDRLPAITSLVDDFKDNVNKYLDDVYTKFKMTGNIVRLSKESKQLDNGLKELIHIADEYSKSNLKTSTCNLNEIKEDLQKTCATFELANRLLTIHKELQRVNSLRSEKSYIETVECFKGIHSSLEAIREEERNMVALNKMISLFVTEKTDFFMDVKSVTSKYMNIDTSSSDKAIWKIWVENIVDLEEVLLACEVYDDCIEFLDDCVDFLWNNVFVTIIDKGACVEIEEDEQCSIMTIQINKKETDVFDTLDYINRVLDFLHDYLNCPLKKHKSTLSYVGMNLQERLSEILIRKCLEKAIPSEFEEIEQFKNVIQQFELLQNKLIEYEIFTTESLPLTDYINNIETLHVNKKCNEYIRETLMLMKDLQEIFELENDLPFDECDTSNLYRKVFPKCAVSKNCIAILKLVEENLISKCLLGNNLQAKHYIYATQKFFYLYNSVIAVYHKKLLQINPEQVALFHNSCMYMAFKLSQWNDLYKTKLSPELLVNSVLFVDQPYLLRKTGSEVFSLYVKQQIEQMENILIDSGVNALQTENELITSVDKAVLECLERLELLQAVWRKILSHQIYNKTIGLLLNSFCMSLINEVLKLKEISSKLAVDLRRIFQIVIVRGQQLFIDDIKEMGSFVKTWTKFSELTSVLNTSLIDIDGKWANGEGSLALCFEVEEVKRLICALFEDTSKRKQILTKINK